MEAPSDALDAAVAAAVAAGIPVVVAAGNGDEFGYGVDACSQPGSGAVGDHRRRLRPLRPASLASPTTAAAWTCSPRGWTSRRPYVDSDTATWTDSGTSMAAPHVAGIVARILQATPGLTPPTVAARLLSQATTGKISDPAGLAQPAGVRGRPAPPGSRLAHGGADLEGRTRPPRPRSPGPRRRIRAPRRSRRTRSPGTGPTTSSGVRRRSPCRPPAAPPCSPSCGATGPIA